MFSRRFVFAMAGSILRRADDAVWTGGSGLAGCQQLLSCWENQTSTGGPIIVSTTAVAPGVAHRSHRNGLPLGKGAMLTCLPLLPPASRSSRSPSPSHRVAAWLTPRTTSPVHETRCCPFGQAAPHFLHVVVTIPSRAAAMILHNAAISPRRHRGLSPER